MMDSPPVTVQEVRLVFSERPNGIFVGCPSNDHAQHIPHERGPDLRVVRGTAANSLTLDSTGITTSASVSLSGSVESGFRLFIVHEPWVGPSEQWQLVEHWGTTPIVEHPAMRWRKHRAYDRVVLSATPRVFRKAWFPRRT
jgi:hypothetical protein